MTTTDAFLVFDLGSNATSAGVVRLARKILQGGAKEMARSKTYQFASFGMKVGGASGGISLGGEDRDVAIAAFLAEVRPMIASGELLIDAGKGLRASDLAPLDSVDSRSLQRRREVDGRSQTDHALAVGAVAAAEAAVGGLDGKTVAIEGFDASGVAIAEQVVAKGGAVVACSTIKGAALRGEGFDPAVLHHGWTADGAGCVASFGDESEPAEALFDQRYDVLFCGSKMGVINHHVAERIDAAAIVPTNALPYTTKAMLVMHRKGAAVLPDYITTAGPIFSDWPPSGDDQASIDAAIHDSIAALTSELVAADQPATMEAAHRAEAFMATWLDELPFGRPFAP